MTDSPIIIHSPRTLENPTKIRRRPDCSVLICRRRVAIKRFFLPFVGATWLLLLPVVRNFLYLPMVVFFVSFVLYWNFPILILFTNSRPLYYEDLFIDQSKIPLLDIDPRIKQRFEMIFEWSLIFTNSLFTAALADYWLYQTVSHESYVEMIGITGGILKIFQFINHIDGTIILYITKALITKELTKKKRIEMVRLSDTDHCVEESRVNEIIIGIGVDEQKKK